LVQYALGPDRGFDPCPPGSDLSIAFQPLRHWSRFGLLLSFSHASTFLPPFAPRPLRRFLATMRVLTSLGSHLTQGISPIHSTQTSDRSVSNHPRVHLGRFLLTLVPSAPGLPLRTVSRLHPSGLGLRLFPSRLADSRKPNRVPLVRTGRSPPVAPHPASLRRSFLRLSMSERLMGEDFHLSVCVRFRAHWGSAPRAEEFGVASGARRWSVVAVFPAAPVCLRRSSGRGSIVSRLAPRRVPRIGESECVIASPRSPSPGRFAATLSRV